MTLTKFKENGNCDGCYFFCKVDMDGRKECTFHWFDDESEDWEFSKNCDEINEL